VNKSILVLVLYSLSLILLTFGLIVILVSVKFKTDKAPSFPIWNPRKWRPIWRCREWFTPKGFRFCLIGNLMGGVGGVLLVIAGFLS